MNCCCLFDTGKNLYISSGKGPFKASIDHVHKTFLVMPSLMDSWCMVPRLWAPQVSLEHEAFPDYLLFIHFADFLSSVWLVRS